MRLFKYWHGNRFITYPILLTCQPITGNPPICKEVFMEHPTLSNLSHYLLCCIHCRHKSTLQNLAGLWYQYINSVFVKYKWKSWNYLLCMSWALFHSEAVHVTWLEWIFMTNTSLQVHIIPIMLDRCILWRNQRESTRSSEWTRLNYTVW